MSAAYIESRGTVGQTQRKTVVSQIFYSTNKSVLSRLQKMAHANKTCLQFVCFCFQSDAFTNISATLK